jgi:hypothetical protein
MAEARDDKARDDLSQLSVPVIIRLDSLNIPSVPDQYSLRSCLIGTSGWRSPASIVSENDESGDVFE